MERQHVQILALTALLLLSTLFVGCGSGGSGGSLENGVAVSEASRDSEIKDEEREEKEEDEEEEKENESSTSTSSSTEIKTFFVDEGRLLASHCYQCHGTNGVSVTEWDSIAGEDELAHEMFGDDALMDAQANGYTATEIRKMEIFLSTLKSND